MYAWRTTWKAKPGRLQEAVALLGRAPAGPPMSEPVTTRAYTAQTNEGEILVFDEMWPTIEAHDHWWDEFRKLPEHDTFFAQWDQVVDLFRETERWQVTEWRF